MKTKIKFIFLFWFFLLFLSINNSRSEPKLETVLKLNQNNRTTSLDQILNQITSEHNLVFKRNLFADYYLFEINHHVYKRQTEFNETKWSKMIRAVELKLGNDSRIEWYEMQKTIQRYKRSNYSKSFRFDYLEEEQEQFDYIYDISKRSSATTECKQPSQFSFNDPSWHKQWYMHDGCSQGQSLNVTSAWRLGFTGRNIVVTIIDDGIEKDHDELKDNYDASASKDLNGNDLDPQPRYDPTNENNHGTRCAGQVAAKANNSKCGVGIAYNSRVGGIRLLDGRITDGLEAEALTFNLKHIDIFSSSWGPPDDGQTVDGPGVLSRAALLNGIRVGRDGKGTVYVWAAGNGGRHNDNCNCDGYTASIYTITIGGVTYNGQMPAYSERCSATLASTYSSGHKSADGIVTADLHNDCTAHHSGTSASAPQAAAIIALVLEANSKLTWRDIQYLIVHTADSFKLKAKDWQKNGNGKIFSHNYGFGLMNAGRMVEWALRWPLVEQQLTCKVTYPVIKLNKEFYLRIKPKRTHTFSLFITKMKPGQRRTDGAMWGQCKEKKLNYLEHVISHLTLKGGVRGQIEINLISPYNTTSQLLELRRKDKSSQGFVAWPFMSVYHWGEQPFGLWRLEIVNLSDIDLTLKEWHLEFFGVQNKVI
jgi:subtilisin family serine protease